MLEDALAPDESERNENDVSLGPVLGGGGMVAVRQPWAMEDIFARSVVVLPSIVLSVLLLALH